MSTFQTIVIMFILFWVSCETSLHVIYKIALCFQAIALISSIKNNFFKCFFWCAPFGYLYFLSFLIIEWTRIGCRNLSWHGFGTISIKYSIGRDTNPRPSNPESSTPINNNFYYFQYSLSLRPQFTTLLRCNLAVIIDTWYFQRYVLL